MKELKVAIQAAKEAGKIINRHFDSDLKVEMKADNSPVTVPSEATENPDELAPPKENLSPGSTGENVKILQKINQI